MNKDKTLQYIDLQFLKITKAVAAYREKKEKTVDIIDELISKATSLIVQMHLEKMLFYQHEVMKEDAKISSEINKNNRKKSLKLMEKSAMDAQKFVEDNDLGQWRARTYRAMGRVSDYKKQYKKAIKYYQEAIKNYKKDPEYIKERVPRNLEYNAFLSFSTIMSGSVKKGLHLAKKTYDEFRKGEGLKLKKVDFPTWAIWMSGIPIRTIKAVIEKNASFSKQELLEWLKDAEKHLRVPRGSKKWLGKVDFELRKDEITAVKRMLESH